MEIIFATGNKHKLKEAKEILGSGFVLKTPYDFGISEDLPETSNTIEGNAVQKAKYIWDKLHLPCFADDTGLEVDYLNGAPGVYSARYAGETKSAKDNMIKLLKDMNGANIRSARFKCVVAFVKDGKITTFEGIAEGDITDNPKGDGGFGYDPIFRPRGYTKCYSELPSIEKNKISHRGKAMRLFSDYINNLDK